MGKQEFGIYVETPVIRAGSVLKGKLWADLDKESNGSKVTLSFTGEEYSVIIYTRNENDHRDNSITATTQTRTACKKRNIINLTLPVNQTTFIQNGKILPGKYELPFEINLPNVLPASLKDKYHDGSYCEILYRLNAEIKGSGFFRNYTSEQIITMLAQPLQRDVIPYTTPPVTENVNFLCCFNKGSISVIAKVNDIKIGIGETITIIMACRNHSSSNIKNITATIYQDSKWEAEGHRKSNRTELIQTDFPDLVHSMQPNKSGSITGNVDSFLLQEIQSETYTAKITIPSNALPTYTGQLMSIRHMIQIVITTGSCVTNPELQIPIEIGCVAIQEVNNNTSPQGDAVPDDFTGNVTNVPIATDNTNVVLGGKPGDGETTTTTTTIEPKNVTTLLNELDASVQDLALIQDMVNDLDWKNVFTTLSSSDYGNIIKQISSEFEQPSIAEIIAQNISNFTCTYVLKALQNTAEWNRGSVLEKLLPHTIDIKENYTMIQNELTEWEKMTTQSTFEKYII